MRCTECNGIDPEKCAACGGSGIFEVTGCPLRYPTADVLKAMYAARQAELGQWPVAGGWLDQTQICLEAVDFINSEREEWKRRNAEDA